MTAIEVEAARLADLFDEHLLATMVAEGYVRSQSHPELPYLILNYTEAAAYEGVWNEVTLACRGLIYDTTTSHLVARPFGKFFNYGQPGAPELALDGPAVVTDKADGSLAVLYPTPDGHAVATRGSFTSDQALHATEVWRSRYAARFTPPAGVTMLFEIVYPANRIVVDYGDLDDLVLLGAVDNVTGRSLGPSAVVESTGWPGPVVETFAYASLAEALAAPPRDNREGLVVHLAETDQRVKVKYEEYVRLHRIVTGLSARVVWQHIVDGAPLDALIAPLPDEFHPWVRQVAEWIATEVANGEAAIDEAYARLVADLPEGFSRKDFALRAVAHPLKWGLFLRLDGRQTRPELLRNARPAPNWTPSGRLYSEDTA